LLPFSVECHDAQTKDGRLAQIKATQGDGVALCAQPDHLIVIQLQKDGTIIEIYNGPVSVASLFVTLATNQIAEYRKPSAEAVHRLRHFFRDRELTQPEGGNGCDALSARPKALLHLVDPSFRLSWKVAHAV
jgi:hypothetical protein